MTKRCRKRSARQFTLVSLLAVAFSLAIAPQASARFGGGGGGGRFGGGGFGGSHSGGGGFRGSGGDGFGGGSFGHNSSGGKSSWNHSSSSSEQHGQDYNSYHSNSSEQHQAYNTHNANEMAEQQSKYNEANTLQENHEQTEKSMHNSTMNTINNNVGQTNWNGGGGGGGGGYYGPYGGCCSGGGSDTGAVLGAAALGTVGGLAVGSAIANANRPTTTVVENYPAYGYQPAPYGAPALGTTVYSLPSGAIATDINGSTYFTENGVYYKPFYSGSQVLYIVSQP